MTLDTLLIAILAALYAVGLVGHLVPATRRLMLSLTPWTLTLCGLAVTARAFTAFRPAALIWMAATAVVSFAFEAVGTATGRIFGPYRYGPTLGPSLFRVPLVIAFNWMLVVLGGLSLSHVLGLPAPLRPVTAAAVAALFDFVMEPVAVRLDYWTWTTPDGRIPWRNYAAWFLIAFAAATAWTLLRLPPPSAVPASYLAIQAAFFTLLRISRTSAPNPAD